MHIRHMLVAVDLSPLSERAVEEAVRWIKAFRGELAKVTLLHVDETPSLGISDGGELVEVMTKIARARSERLGHLAHLLSEAGAEVAVEVAAGSPHEEILRAIDRLGADWLVVTRRQNGEEGFLLGSTTKRILRKVSCPVLVCGGAQDVDPTKILVTTDFSAQSAHGLHEAADLTRHLSGATLTAVHALRLPLFVPVLPGELPLQLPQDSITHLQALQEGELNTWIKANAPANVAVGAQLLIGTSVAKAISGFAREQGVGLIVVASLGRGAIASFFLGSTAQSLIEYVPCAVLVLPAESN